MTAATSIEPHREFVAHLPPSAQRSLNMTQAVVALVHAACRNHGWTPKLLAQECGRDLADVINAGAVVTDRLRKAATHPPPNARARPAKPLCGLCEGGWIYHVPDDPRADITTTRCDCRKATQ